MMMMMMVSLHSFMDDAHGCMGIISRVDNDDDDEEENR